MPVPLQYRDLMADLEKATSAGEVEWNVDKAGTSVFVELGENVLKLYAGEDEDSGSFVSATLMLPSEFQKTTPGRRASLDHWYLDEGDEDYQRIYNLIMAANRKAKGIDQRLEQMRRLLQSRLQK